MSKLNVDEIRDSLDSETAPPNIPGLKPQLAAATVFYDGITNQIIRSYNISSVQDNGAGEYLANYITPISDDGSNDAIAVSGTSSNALAVCSSSTTACSFDVYIANTAIRVDRQVTLVVFGTF